MKIIGIDNFDRDYVSDTLVCENVDKETGQYLTKCLNERYSGSIVYTYYKLVEDHYVLSVIDY